MLKILIVEDDKTIRDVLRENIEKWGFEGFCEEDFSDVFATFVQYNPDLVLLDINLPFYDGFYWCNKIREVSKVPIVFISSRDTRMDIVMAMNMGGDDFIQKPFYIDVVMAKINAILRRTYSYTNMESNVIEHDGIVLNLQEGNFLCGEEKVELTKNEFKILYILMKSSGNIVSRDKIMRNLWEDESFVDDNTLTVNIARLRKKLKDAGKDDFIKTKKGQGYIIV
ncbi:transcriptional regulator [Aneurinibacillus migulanus]|uniref:DNA-binding response regulator, OmpR family, contains REC and winged-helix (WHTH) domain n=1 Tax=Aneurinibacillus migulanus TaxID=47500 RepID=A0A0D1XZI1_ANEMI|nr:transcriptional regulator [Aneurinibacillus migulanus]KON93119.1 transcriptional regulator [Aneurinibacillus migulanus]MED0890990.1 response regulator transcription factor [Aneurinibacillus migulanus]MED1614631.1 response regulator transcription factor [Aneurinibacillus migulanus]SDK31455.1 DNA-binding response regulator, OmpR family, contains REC and winged-helix (wHTH) domain [Aneurinibacillus migulanus]